MSNGKLSGAGRRLSPGAAIHAAQFLGGSLARDAWYSEKRLGTVWGRHVPSIPAELARSATPKIQAGKDELGGCRSATEAGESSLACLIQQRNCGWNWCKQPRW